MTVPPAIAAILLYVYTVCVSYSAIACTKQCPDSIKAHCTRQIPGHLYPAAFVVLFAHTVATRQPRWYQNRGLVLFGVLYVVLDLLLQNGKLDMTDPTTVQHATFTLGITCIGLIRHLYLCRGRCCCCVDIDAALFAAITFLFAFFVSQHPQPNAIGNTMHTATIVFAVAAYAARINEQVRVTTIMLVAGGCTFVHSQLALTHNATQQHIDAVAYLTASTVVAMAVALSFERATAARHQPALISYSTSSPSSA